MYCAAGIGSPDPAAPRGVARQCFRMRMPESIAVSRRKHGFMCVDSREKRPCRRSAAAVMRGNDDLAAQRRRRCQQAFCRRAVRRIRRRAYLCIGALFPVFFFASFFTLPAFSLRFAHQQPGFRRRVDVAGQQGSASGGLNLQHAAQMIRLGRCVGIHGFIRMQERKSHAVPRPMLPRCAGFAAKSSRCRREQARDRQRRLNRSQSPRMVGIAVRNDQRVEPSDTRRTQKRRHNALPGIRLGAVTRSGIVEQIVRRRAHGDRQSLPDIQHIDPGFARRRPRRLPEQCRQEQQAAQPACRKTARQQ